MQITELNGLCLCLLRPHISAPQVYCMSYTDVHGSCTATCEITSESFQPTTVSVTHAWLPFTLKCHSYPGAMDKTHNSINLTPLSPAGRGGEGYACMIWYFSAPTTCRVISISSKCSSSSDNEEMQLPRCCNEM